MARTGPPTVLFEVFWAHQKRKRLLDHALADVELPTEDYPFYVTIGADGPLRPPPRGGVPPHRGLSVLCDDRRRRAAHPDCTRGLSDDAALDRDLPREAARSARPCGTRAEPGRRPLLSHPPHGRRSAAARRSAAGLPRLRGGGRGAARAGA